MIRASVIQSFDPEVIFWQVRLKVGFSKQERVGELRFGSWKEIVEMMNKRRCVLTLLVVSVVLWSAFSPSAAQELQASIRQKFLFLPAYRECRPAEVTGFAFGNQPLEVLLAQVYVRNRSDKIITAVRVGWTAYDHAYGVQVAGSACEEIPIAALARLSGSSDLIELGSLASKETITLGTKPLMIEKPANKTIFVDRAFVTAENVKSLIPEDDRNAEKFMLLIYISEVHYEDGTTWTSNE